MKSFGVTETKLFHFHRIFKNGGGVGEGAGRGFDRVGLSKPPEPHLDPPLDRSRLNRRRVTQLFWLNNGLRVCTKCFQLYFVNYIVHDSRVL